MQDALALVKKEPSSMSFKEDKTKPIIKRNKGKKKSVKKSFILVKEEATIWVFITSDAPAETINVS